MAMPMLSYWKENRMNEALNLRKEALNEELEERQGMATESMIYSIFTGIGLGVVLAGGILYFARR